MIATQITNAALGLVNTEDHVDPEPQEYELVGDDPRPFRGVPDDFIFIETDHAYWPNWAKPTLWSIAYGYRREHNELGVKDLRVYYYNRHKGKNYDSWAAGFNAALKDVLKYGTKELPAHLAKSPKIVPAGPKTGLGGTNNLVHEVDNSRGAGKRAIKRVRYA